MKTNDTPVLNRQSLADICIQQLGGIGAWFALAWANDKGITDTLIAGETIQTTDATVAAAEIVDFYNARNITPATALSATELEALEGIGYWTIGRTFKIITP